MKFKNSPTIIANNRFVYWNKYIKNTLPKAPNENDILGIQRTSLISAVLLFLFSFFLQKATNIDKSYVILNVITGLGALMIYCFTFLKGHLLKYLYHIIYAIITIIALAQIFFCFQNNFNPYFFGSAILFIVIASIVIKDNKTLKLYYLFFSTILCIAFLFNKHSQFSQTEGILSILICTTTAFYVFNNRIKQLIVLKNSEKRLETQQAAFKNLFDELPMAIILVNDKLEITKVNAQTKAQLNFDDSDFYLSNLLKYIHAEDALSADNIIKQIALNNSYNAELRIQNAKREFIWYKIVITKLTDVWIEDTAFVVTLEDLSYQKEADKKLREYAKRLEIQNKALEEFSYVISHDLQEPLRMITSYTQIIQRRYINKINDKNAEIDMSYVIDGAKRMSELINDMLAYSRWSTSTLKVEDVESIDILAEVLKNLTVSIKETNAEIICSDMPTVCANRLMLGQVIQNLISNAMKYREEERALMIEINAKKRDGDYIFAIKDNGMGFENNEKERIFGIFQRLHNRHSKYSGTGMGLAICKRLIEKQGGRIWADSKVGMGSTFYFTLPIFNASAS